MSAESWARAGAIFATSSSGSGISWIAVTKMATAMIAQSGLCCLHARRDPTRGTKLDSARTDVATAAQRGADAKSSTAAHIATVDKISAALSLLLTRRHLAVCHGYQTRRGTVITSPGRK